MLSYPSVAPNARIRDGGRDHLSLARQQVDETLRPVHADMRMEKQDGAPLPRLRISMFAPAIFSVTGPSAESMFQSTLIFASRITLPQRAYSVCSSSRNAASLIGSHFRALIEQHLFHFRLHEDAVDLAVQLREHRRRRRARREQRVPDYHVEIRETRLGDRRDLRRENRAVRPVMAIPRSFPARICGSTVGAAANMIPTRPPRTSFTPGGPPL